MVNIKENLYSLNKNIDELKNSIRPAIVAVSKQQNFEKIIEAFKAGQTIFAENYLQEALDKQKLLKEYPIEWHFIGPIQSNKCKLIAENFHWVQTEDKLIRELTLLKKIFDNLKIKNKNMDTLSVGMSEDYLLALNYGSTMIRVGSHIFGARK
jgi:uncharacterized pyridoxal phosphate-containing UPF0001 family protein